MGSVSYSLVPNLLQISQHWQNFTSIYTKRCPFKSQTFSILKVVLLLPASIYQTQMLFYSDVHQLIKHNVVLLYYHLDQIEDNMLFTFHVHQLIRQNVVFLSPASNYKTTCGFTITCINLWDIMLFNYHLHQLINHNVVLQSPVSTYMTQCCYTLTCINL